MELSLSKMDWQGDPSTREKIYFFVVLVMIVVAFSRLLWIPTYQVIQKKKAEMASVKLQIKTLEDFFKVQKKIEPPKPVVNQEAIDKKLEAALKGKSGDPRKIVSDVTKEITSLRKMGSLTLQNISFEPPQVEIGYLKFPVTVSVLGSFPGLQNYLARLESSDYLFIVDNVKFALSEKNPGLIEGELKCSLFVASLGGVSTPSASGAGSSSKAKPKKPADSGESKEAK